MSLFMATPDYPQTVSHTARAGPSLLRRAPRRDRPDRLQAVVADHVVVVVEVDGGIAVAGDQLDFVAHLQLPVASLQGQLAVLVAAGRIAGARQVLDG